MPSFCPLANRQAEGGKKCSIEESPQKSPQGDVFPWPLCQHITLLYRMLPTPQLFRNPNKRAFKLFFLFFVDVWKGICLLCQMSPLMYTAISYWTCYVVPVLCMELTNVWILAFNLSGVLVLCFTFYIYIFYRYPTEKGKQFFSSCSWNDKKRPVNMEEC